MLQTVSIARRQAKPSGDAAPDRRAAGHEKDSRSSGISAAEFSQLKTWLYDTSGIHLSEHKHALVTGRLSTRLPTPQQVRERVLDVLERLPVR